jgi:hypothetical protein
MLVVLDKILEGLMWGPKGTVAKRAKALNKSLPAQSEMPISLNAFVITIAQTKVQLTSMTTG